MSDIMCKKAHSEDLAVDVLYIPKYELVYSFQQKILL